MPRILVCEFMDPAAVDRLRRDFDVHYDPQLVDRPAELEAAVAEVDALIVRNRTQVRGDLLARAAKLRVVGRLGVGLDNIDLAACRERGIEVIPATGANARAVAEYVVCTAMLLLRGAYTATAQVAAGAWPRAALSSGREAGGKILGLVGFGGIGQLTARMAEGVGMETVAYDPHLPDDMPLEPALQTRLVDFAELLRCADVVSLHVPLTEETRNLMSRERLARMKAGAVLINTARGGIVDEQALAELLREGHLGGAALDVYAAEPLPAGSPLADAPNLVLTPHIAGVTLESNRRVSSMIAERVAGFLSA